VSVDLGGLPSFPCPRAIFSHASGVEAAFSSLKIEEVSFPLGDSRETPLPCFSRAPPLILNLFLGYGALQLSLRPHS